VKKKRLGPKVECRNKNQTGRGRAEEAEEARGGRQAGQAGGGPPGGGGRRTRRRALCVGGCVRACACVRARGEREEAADEERGARRDYKKKSFAVAGLANAAARPRGRSEEGRAPQGPGLMKKKTTAPAATRRGTDLKCHAPGDEPPR
jgi:hypothetical protein